MIFNSFLYNPVDIHIFDEQSDLIFSPKSIQPIVKEVIFFEGEQCDEVSIYFVTQEMISQLHGVISRVTGY